MENSGFFQAELDEVTGEYDREYLASEFANYFKLFIGNGVFGSPTNQLKVIAGNGLQVIVKQGWAFIEGLWYHNDSDLVLNVEANVTAFSRQDSIMCRLDSANRKISSVSLSGVTEVTRDGAYYDLKLAEVTVGVASAQISESDIRDTRTDESVCGIVTGLLKVQETSDLFLQFESMFNTWFEQIKGQLSGDVAGNLQSQIDEIEDRVEELEAGGGGGNSTGVDITYADYLALGDKVNTDNVDYYITDPPESWNLPKHCKVRYIDDPNNENYDWVQVLHNGNWINFQRAYTQRRDLYMTSANEGNFGAYAGTVSASGQTSRVPSLTLGSEMVVKSTVSNNEQAQGVAISELIDLSKYKTIHLNHTSTSSTSNERSYVILFVTNAKSPKMTSLAAVELLKPGATSNNGDITLDVSAINEKCYVGIEISSDSLGGVVTVSTSISDFYME